MKLPLLLASALPLVLAASLASAQVSPSRLSFVANSAGNQAFTNGTLALDSNASSVGSFVSATTSRSFTGMDRNGDEQTMQFSGATSASVEFGRIHTAASGSLVNSYFNEENPFFWDGTTVNEEGSPDNFRNVGLGSFTDVLTYGGGARAGHDAQYVFFVEGNVTGDGINAFLGATIANTPRQFFDINPPVGRSGNYYATTKVPVGALTGQVAVIDFNAQFRAKPFELEDGSSVIGSGDFSATATLVAIEIYDENGNLVTDATAVGASGTTYATIRPVPEPASMAALGLGALALLRRRRWA